MPLNMMSRLGKLTNNDKWQNMAQIGKYAFEKIEESITTYDFFMRGDWTYVS